jgi:hypothetical protein
MIAGTTEVQVLSSGQLAVLLTVAGTTVVIVTTQLLDNLIPLPPIPEVRTLGLQSAALGNGRIPSLAGASGRLTLGMIGRDNDLDGQAPTRTLSASTPDTELDYGL